MIVIVVFGDSIVNVEQAIFNLKFNNEVCIIWADSLFCLIEYVLVYLLGFMAIYVEGELIYWEFVVCYGCNFYVA